MSRYVPRIVIVLHGEADVGILQASSSSLFSSATFSGTLFAYFQNVSALARITSSPKIFEISCSVIKYALTRDQYYYLIALRWPIG